MKIIVGALGTISLALLVYIKMLSNQSNKLASQLIKLMEERDQNYKELVKSDDENYQKLLDEREEYRKQILYFIQSQTNLKNKFESQG